MLQATHHCQGCNRPLAPDAPRGYCPACLLSTALLDDDELVDAPEETPGPDDGDVNDFQLGEVLGEGGFGTVYRATQRHPIQREVALKVLKRGMATPQVLARFEAERQALARMNHPGIASVYDAGETADGRPYFAMELVEGRALTDYCQDQPLDLEQKLTLFLGLCSAIAHAHQRGVIHRDIKPSNILVGPGEKLKVIDFGVAKAMAEPLTNATVFTKVHQTIGTPVYMSPEQAAMSPQVVVDTRADVYALGCVLYEVLAKRPPFDPTALAALPFSEMLETIREREPTAISALQSGVPRDLDWIVSRAMAKEVDRRYPSVDSLSEDIQRFLWNEPVEAAAPSRVYRARKFIRRHRLTMTLGALAALLLVIGMVTSLLLYLRSERAFQEVAIGKHALTNAFSNSDVRLAEQFLAQGNAGAAVQSLCRALRTNPGHEVATSNLLALLAHHRWVRPAAASFPINGLETDTTQIRLIERGRHGLILASSENGSTLTQIHLPTKTTQELHLNRKTTFEHFEAHEHGHHALVAADKTASLIGLSGSLRVITEHQLPAKITGLAVMTDSYWIGTAAGEVLEYNLSDGKLIRELEPISGSAHSLTTWRPRLPKLDRRPRGLLLAADSRGSVHGWDLENGERRFTTRPQRFDIASIQWIPSGQRALVATTDGTLRILDAYRGKYLGDRMHHGAEIVDVATHPANRAILTGATNGSVRLWSSRTGRPKVGGFIHDAPITLSTFMPDRQRGLSVDRLGNGRLWSLAQGQSTGEPLSQTRRLHHVALSEDDRMIFSVDATQREATFWNLDQQPAIARRLDLCQDTANETQQLSSSAWSPNGQRQLRIENEGRAIRLWNRSGEALSQAIAIPTEVTGVRFHAPCWAEIRGKDGFSCLVEIPPPSTRLPTWFLDFAEAYVRDHTESPFPDTPETDAIANTYASWLTDSSRDRTLSPQSDFQFQHYVDEILENRTATAARHVLAIDSDNQRAVRLMHETNFGAEPNRHR